MKFLQRALKVKDDGQFGLITAAAARVADYTAAVDAALAERLAYYMKLPAEKTAAFAGGWSNRMVKLCREVMA